MVLYNAMTAGMVPWPRITVPWEESGHLSPWLAFLPIFAVYFGNYIIYNLFISILLSGFAEDDDSDHSEAQSPNTPRVKETWARKTLRACSKLLGWDVTNGNNASQVYPVPTQRPEQGAASAGPASLARNGQSLNQRKLFALSSAMDAIEEDEKELEMLVSVRVSAVGRGGIRAERLSGGGGEEESHLYNLKRWERVCALPSNDRRFAVDMAGCLQENHHLDEPPQQPHRIFGKLVQVKIAHRHKSLGLLGPKSTLRLCAAYVVHHPYFDRFIILCILATSATLIWEQPDDWIRGSASNCPVVGLDCSGASFPGHTVINCERNAQDANFGRVHSACGTPEENGCCAIVRRNNIIKVLRLPLFVPPIHPSLHMIRHAH